MLFAAFCADFRRALDCPVVSFRAAAGKVNLIDFCADCRGAFFSCGKHCFCRIHAKRVNTGGIAVLFGKKRERRIHHALRDLCGCGIIRIDKTFGFHGPQSFLRNAPQSCGALWFMINLDKNTFLRSPFFGCRCNFIIYLLYCNFKRSTVGKQRFLRFAIISYRFGVNLYGK